MIPKWFRDFRIIQKVSRDLLMAFKGFQNNFKALESFEESLDFINCVWRRLNIFRSTKTLRDSLEIFQMCFGSL